MPDLIILDEQVAEGFKSAAGGFNTSIVHGGGGAEYRNGMWAIPRKRWEFSFNHKTLAAIQTVMDFIEDRRGMLYPWLLKDWLRHRLTDELILTATGGETTAQIKQSFGPNNALSLDRKHIKAGTVTVKKNGVALSQADSPGEFDVNSTGLITFASALSAADAITVTCEFYHKVRFEADIYHPEAAGPSAVYGRIGSISAIEVRS